MTDEPTYTLDQAKRELDRRECTQHGHDFDVIVTGGGDVARVICARCGASWVTSPEHEPARSVRVTEAEPVQDADDAQTRMLHCPRCRSTDPKWNPEPCDHSWHRGTLDRDAEGNLIGWTFTWPPSRVVQT